MIQTILTRVSRTVADVMQKIEFEVITEAANTTEER